MQRQSVANTRLAYRDDGNKLYSGKWKEYWYSQARWIGGVMVGASD